MCRIIRIDSPTINVTSDSAINASAATIANINTEYISTTPLSHELDESGSQRRRDAVESGCEASRALRGVASHPAAGIVCEFDTVQV